MQNSNILMYTTEDGITKVEVTFDNETVWLSLDQMAELFQRDKSTISRHIKNIFAEGELNKNSVVANFATTASDGKVYQVDYYNLDVIISVGYRVKSLRGTQFRIWATNVLKEYIEDGEIFDIEGIKVQAIHTPGHTLGHMCYVVDDKVLFTGDCLAVNDNGGYSFFDFFTQYPDMNKKSLLKLKKLSLKIHPEYVCTGHRGMRAFSEKIFAHMNESAPFSRKRPFDNKAPYDICN